jgi:hypothetical protein
MQIQEGRYKVRSFLPLACASQPRGRFRLVAKSSLLCVGCFGNRTADCWATLAGWLWMRFFCDRRRRRLRNAASDAGTFLFLLPPHPFFFWPVHYPSVRSKRKEWTSLSVVSLLLLLLLHLPVNFVLELLVYLVFFFFFFFSSIYLWFRSKSSLLTSSLRDFPTQRRRASHDAFVREEESDSHLQSGAFCLANERSI